jgi:hypothetical protein
VSIQDLLAATYVRKSLSVASNRQRVNRVAELCVTSMNQAVEYDRRDIEHASMLGLGEVTGRCLYELVGVSALVHREAVRRNEEVHAVCFKYFSRELESYLTLL